MIYRDDEDNNEQAAQPDPRIDANDVGDEIGERIGEHEEDPSL